MFELHKLIWNTKQGDLDVASYFNKLRNLWLELDHYQLNVGNSGKTSIAWKEAVDRDRIFEFLAGLNPE